jgi:hypothetical protein
MGMSENEVTVTIGPPTTFDTYQTPKAYLPFPFNGSDTARKISHYKGVGRITYSQDSAYASRFSVIGIDYDPSEPGFGK